MKSASVTGKITKTHINTDKYEVTLSLDEPDAKIMYQAYKLNRLPKGWNVVKGMNPVEFIAVADEFIKTTYDMNFSVKLDGKPLLILFGVDNSRFILLGDVIWNPKTSNRKKLETVAAVLNFIRKDRVGLIEADYEFKKFYEHIEDRKIIRRVGSLYDTEYKNSRTTFFQTRMA